MPMKRSPELLLSCGRVVFAVALAALTLTSARAVTFPDPRLESAVRDELPKPSGEITADDMLELTVLHAAGRGIEDTSGLETSLNLQTLYFEGNPVTNYSGVAGLPNLALLEWPSGQIADTTFLAGLHALTNLNLNRNPVTNYASLSGLTNLVRLDFNGSGMSNLSFVSALTKLQTLSVYDNQIQDISSLSGLSELQTVQLDWNAVTNLDVLSGMTNLVNLSLAGNGVTNLDFIAPLQRLQSLGLYVNLVQDISPLTGRTNLLSLGLGWNGVTNPAVISTLTGLQNLAVDGNQLTNVVFLAGLTNLTSLSLAYTWLADMSPLTNLTRLNDMNVGENSLTNLPDLSSLTHLKTFMMAGNQITDLSPLTNLIAMLELHAQRNLFSSVAPVSGCPWLERLLLSGNTLTNLAELVVLTNLHYLQLREMQLTNLDFVVPLTALDDLDVGDNLVVNLSPLTNLPYLHFLSAERNRLVRIDPLLDCPSFWYMNLRENYLDTNTTSAAWNVITNLLGRGVTVDYEPQNPPPVPIEFLSQPANRSAFVGNNVLFSVSVTGGTPGPSYRWQKDSVDLVDNTRITGTETDTLQITDVNPGDAGLYRVRVWDGWIATNSLTAELKVITNVVFADPNLEQAVRDALAIPTDPLTPADLVGLYSLTASYRGITNLAGIEALADLVGLDLSGNPAIASFQPLTYLAPLNALWVNACGLDSLDWVSSLPYLNELRFGDNFIEDLSPLRGMIRLVNVYADENRLTVIDPLLDLTQLQYVNVTRNHLDTNSASAAWAVITNLEALDVLVDYDPQYAAPVLPEIVSQPVNVAAYVGDNIHFTVIASGNGSGLNYQWQRNGVNLLNDPHISGTDGDTLYIDAVTAADAGTYRVRVWDDLGVTNSRLATLRVINSVAFVDPHLEQAVRDSLGIPSAPITLEDMRSLTVLIAHQLGITNLTGLEAAANLQYLNLGANPGITDFTMLAELPSLSQIFLDECVVPDLSFVSTLPSLWEFAATGGQVGDLSPLAACPLLEILNLGGNPALTNLVVLNTLTNLQSLSLDSSGISNISFVEFMSVLRFLNLWGNVVQDLGPLTNCPNLDQLEGGYNLITNAAVLAACTNLGGLSLPGNQFDDLSFVADLWKLGFLNVEGNPIHDLSPVAGLTNLYWLAAGWTGVTNLSPVAALTRLDTLFVWNLGISNLDYLAPLTNLIHFGAGQNGITNLPPYSHLSKLTYLNLDGNPLVSMSLVTGLTNLWELYLNRCGIVDVAILTGRTNLHNLALGQNRIYDISPLAGLRFLESVNLSDNNLQSLAPLSALTNLNFVDVRMNFLDISTGSPAMIVIGTLEGRDATVDYDPQKLAPTPIQLSAPTWLAGNQFRFTVTSAPGSALEVLSSASFSGWEHLSYLTNITGTVSFTNSPATGTRKFYRVRLQ